MRRVRWAVLFVLCSTAGPAAGFTWPNTIERVESQLKSSDDATRREAAAQLMDLPPAVARRLVPAILADPDTEVRLAAAEVAVKLRMTGVSDEVVPWLNAPDRRVRLAAAELLRVAPRPRAISALGRVLSDPDAPVRIAAAAALGASAAQEAAMPLLGHLDDSSPQVQRAVIDALARLGDRSAVVPLIGKVQHPRTAVRLSVVRALGTLGDPRAGSALVLALQDSQDSVQVATLVALGRLRAAEATLSIVSLLETGPSSAVRAAALEALARIGSADGIDALMEALAGDSPRRHESPVREALVLVGAPAIPKLTQCLVGQPSPDLADGCALVLGQLAAPGASTAVSEALRRGVVRPPAALRALATLGDAQTLPTVLEYLADPEPRVRRAAIDAAAELLDPRQPDGRAVDPIRRALSAARSSKAEQVALVSLLGRTGSPRAVKTLAPIAEEGDSLVLRIAAIEALGQIGPAGQDRALLVALEAEQTSVRLAAAVALRRAASGASARELLDRLEREAERDRAATAIALVGAMGRCRDPRLRDRAFRLLEQSRDGERDALIEAVGQIPTEAARERLLAFAQGPASLADRAKVAEALAAHPGATAGLLGLAGDVDGSVRANAIWSLGAVGGASEVLGVARAIGDRDVAVAGNAVAALGRIAARSRAPVSKHLCGALQDPRSYVRANALAALAVAGERCADGVDRQLLRDDPTAIVRRAAARLLHLVPASPAQPDQLALQRCAAEEADGSVAGTCMEAPDPLPTDTEPVLVYVVPMGELSPAPRAPFALVGADGLMRLGVTDRRGTVFEPQAPSGEVRLEVPAPLAR